MNDVISGLSSTGQLAVVKEMRLDVAAFAMEPTTAS
jgi:hypothetical protein